MLGRILCSCATMDYACRALRSVADLLKELQLLGEIGGFVYANAPEVWVLCSKHSAM